MFLIETGRNDDFFGAFNVSLCAWMIKDQGIKLGRDTAAVGCRWNVVVWTNETAREN